MGSIIKLRDPIDADAQVHFSYPPVAEIVRMYGGETTSLPKPDLDRSKRWLEWLRGHPFAKIIICDGGPVGQVRLHSLDREDKRARLAIGLFAEEHLGRGIGRKAVRLALDHAFGDMGLHRVDLRVLSFNKRAIRCYASCGFVHEGTEREAAWISGTWYDDWIMGILTHEHTTGT
ncbi:GNAT family protein [uncultured Ruegeria sp.]|uniref:GNAT family N-acetyltransferase n=1 Tax=uncultured Ruegeria sp. TaxID=259304 RepID=UPI00260FF32F|nr:GNAT family protein [uncultured Ruegeria sp.]